MNTISNNTQFNTNFTARTQLAEGLGNKTFDRACKEFREMTKDNNLTLHMWEDGGVYKFDLERKEGISHTTQYVGKDVLGYLMMETGVKDIAKFLKSTLNAVIARQKHNTGNAYMDNVNANIDATIVYLKNNVLRNKIKTQFDNGFADYDKAGACLRLNG